jgi:hypothetical protein
MKILRPRVGFGECERGDLLASDGGYEPSPLLLLGPELENGRRRHLRLNRHRHTETARAGPRHLLREHHSREVIASLAAILRRVPQAEKPELAHPPEDRVREGILLPLLEVGLDLLLQELADVQPELLVGVGEVHRPGV